MSKMVEKTKISPRVIWLEDDLTSSKSRIRVDVVKGRSGSVSGSKPISSCTATPYSNGYDEVTLYCYNNVIINNKYKHSAYVACDYVQ